MPIDERSRKWLSKKTKIGFRGHPIGTIAFYGPDNRRASKVAVGIVPEDGAPSLEPRRWFSEDGDVRKDPAILAEIMAYLRDHPVRTVSMVDRIIGCPHEEGIDYPDGEWCPRCPYWAGRDRWTGKMLNED